jgi:hypothetical protein
MPLNEELSAVDEEGGVEEDEGVSDWPHGHGMLSSRCRGWMARGSSPMPLAVLPLDLALRPTFWPFRHI